MFVKAAFNLNEMSASYPTMIIESQFLRDRLCGFAGGDPWDCGLDAGRRNNTPRTTSPQRPKKAARGEMRLGLD
jgi:hypothetical protein